MITSRPYRSDDDLRLMQDLVRESWRREKPYVAQHVGDLDWWMYQHADLDPTERIHLWFDHERLTGWAWLTPLAALDSHLHPDVRDGRLLEEMLAWLAERARALALDGAPVVELSVWALECDAAAVAVLERNGFRPSDQCFVHTVRPIHDAIPEVQLRDGFVVRHVRGEQDLAERVAVHRAAFAPSSRVTEESYRSVMRSNTYRPDLDIVVVAPDGRFAAFCLCWLDEENGVGELEPVGAHPDFQRMGCARAASVEALRRLRQLGADTAVVYHTGDAAAALYESLGFREITRNRKFSAPLSP